MTTKFPEEAKRGPGRTRALLDTNIWRYVVDNGSQGSLLRLARDGSYDVQIAPGVLYETLRIKHRLLRAKLIKPMVDPRFQRLMPEAYLESMEILREIQRVRPEWLRDAPDLRWFNHLKKDWTRKTGGFWVRCARSPESEARHLRHLEKRMIEDAREQFHNARKETIVAGWTNNRSMDKALKRVSWQIPGRGGDMVEAWRADSLLVLTQALAREGAYRDWLVPFIELDRGLLTSASWVEFWLHQADVSALPRQWMRWAHSFAQRFRKVTPGSPADNQLATYFLETDLVITADKALLEILEECRPHAPCKLPNGKLVPAGATGVAMLLELLDS